MKLKKVREEELKKVLDSIVSDYYHDKDNDGFNLKDVNWLKVGGLIIRIVLAYFASHVDKAQE